MEFVRESEVLGLLREHGVTPVPGESPERVYFRLETDRDPVRIHVTIAGAAAEPADGAEVLEVEPDRLPQAVESIVNKLHLTQILLFPVGKWRHLFDAVAFSLADNEDWQGIDTTATVELNSRDPLLCEPGDFHTVTALVRALLDDAEEPEQGLTLTTTAAPLLMEVVPDGAVRLTLGNQALADEVAEALRA